MKSWTTTRSNLHVRSSPVLTLFQARKKNLLQSRISHLGLNQSDFFFFLLCLWWCREQHWCPLTLQSSTLGGQWLAAVGWDDREENSGHSTPLEEKWDITPASLVGQQDPWLTVQQRTSKRKWLKRTLFYCCYWAQQVLTHLYDSQSMNLAGFE